MKTEKLDRRVRRSRRQLQAALLKLFAEKPFQSITVRDITTAADLNRATFYLHYTDKFDLLIKMTQDMFHDALAEQLPEHGMGHPEDLKALVVTTCYFVAKFLRDCSPLNKPFEPMIEAQIQQQIQAYVLQWLHAEGMAEAELTACDETTATIVSWTVLGTALRWVRNPGDETAESIAEQVYAVVMNGLWRVKPGGNAPPN